MPITPEEVRNKEFAATLRRGYEKDQVDEFLALLADDYQKALDRAATASDPFAAMGQQVADVMRTADAAAGELRRRAEEEAANYRKRAADKALGIRKQAQEEAEQILATARAEADKIRSGAIAVADKTKGEAELLARDLLRSAEGEKSRIIGDAVALNERLTAYEQDLRDRVARATEAFDRIRNEFSNADGGTREPAPPGPEAMPQPDGRPALEHTSP
ncbi:MAG TPA: DivIVA domain-containing protein [Actinomycetota bacterium]|nr:DivIVA domain-containing protein [Actinomycetota bacterium]